jgi:hypothetical protein
VPVALDFRGDSWDDPGVDAPRRAVGGQAGGLSGRGRTLLPHDDEPTAPLDAEWMRGLVEEPST